MKWKLFVIIFAIACLGYLTGCNTVKGIGKDFESAGQGIQKAAD
ncbi:MAG: entericidin A/B family lipoprotein [Chlamydiota bacterium]|nr:entericidin A/B family lipoprotein [Chlamydiota bacterium]